jgi:hypothetical protein
MSYDDWKLASPYDEPNHEDELDDDDADARRERMLERRADMADWMNELIADRDAAREEYDDRLQEEDR